MKQTAIMGGTFDPIHIGHIIAGQTVYDTGLFDEVLFMPSGNPPHKDEIISPTGQRLEMCRQAIKGIEGFAVSEFELSRTGKIYTVDTFRLLKEEDPDTKYWLIIGTDSLYNLETWHDHENLLATVNFLVVDRGGYDNHTIKNLTKSMNAKYEGDFMFIEMPDIELSSSDIRQRVQEGRSIHGRVPDAVRHFIADKGLYR